MRADGAARVETAERFPRLARVMGVVRQVAGMPDYARYCTHMKHRHPECPVPTEKEFYAEYVNTRYGNGATRCC